MSRILAGSSSSATYGRAATLGVVAGLRSQMPSFLLAVAANRGRFAATAAPPVGWLRSPLVLAGVGLLELGELVADKTSLVPSRLRPGPLGGRIFFGSVYGGVVSRDANRSIPAGAVLGALGAAAGSFAGYHGRSSLVRLTNLTDPLVAVGEDALAIGLGLLALPIEPSAISTNP